MSYDLTCPTCAYAAEHGWWGPDHRGRTHCRDCHLSWAAKSQAHCAGCHRQFGGVQGFDLHLSRPPGWEKLLPAEALVCRDPATMLTEAGNPVLVADDDGIWRRWDPRPHPLSHIGAALEGDSLAEVAP